MDIPHLFDADPGGTPGIGAFGLACAQARAAVGTMRGLAAVEGAPDAVERLGDAAQLAREVDMVLARTARDIESMSNVPGGGVARHHGHRSAADLVAATMGTTRAEAHRLLEVGRALEEMEHSHGGPDPDPEDEPEDDPGNDPDDDPADPSDEDDPDNEENDPPAPKPRPQPRYPAVATALVRGEISADCGSQIIVMLDSLSTDVSDERKQDAALELVGRAKGLDATRFARIVGRFKAALDVEQHQRNLARMRRQRTLRMWENRAGMLVINGELDPETAAPVRAVLDALVGDAMRASRDNPGTDERTADQMRADALAALSRHGMSCEATDLPLANVTVVVRIQEKDLRSGLGLGEVDGCTQPVDIATSRRMAANAFVVPAVLGGQGELLDLGRRRRLFTKAQRIAIGERDGGCAFCGAPPAWAEIHHIRWWSHGGRTSVDNGVLLCGHCHHVIHDQGWEIRATATEVWFIPPAKVDPAREPRAGGRARFGPPRAWRPTVTGTASQGPPPGDTPPPERDAA
ncbi:HNH endonuclease [Demequina rhizosphaerae]|uniref:HNH endonuclease n=1 Tax=Demequina rhizosphaerae TaxID=1638985 RepID=UPI0007854846|nr:HNH endonuclease signature motif containing protein [Demequina rhizosphaerae]